MHTAATTRSPTTYKSGKLFQQQISDGKIPLILHLADHDPNGIDMTRDNADRLARFAGHPIEVRRIALNLDQVAQYQPPPNPTKETDSRAAIYIAKFGNKSSGARCARSDRYRQPHHRGD